MADMTSRREKQGKWSSEMGFHMLKQMDSVCGRFEELGNAASVAQLKARWPIYTFAGRERLLLVAQV